MALVFGWLPLYETSWFLKISQLTRLKDDQWLDWLHDFAFKGEQVPKIVILKAMIRNKAVLFNKYASWVLDAHQKGLAFDVQNTQNKNIHH